MTNWKEIIEVYKTGFIARIGKDFLQVNTKIDLVQNSGSSGRMHVLPYMQPRFIPSHHVEVPWHL